MNTVPPNYRDCDSCEDCVWYKLNDNLGCHACSKHAEEYGDIMHICDTFKSREK